MMSIRRVAVVVALAVVVSLVLAAPRAEADPVPGVGQFCSAIPIFGGACATAGNAVGAVVGGVASGNPANVVGGVASAVAGDVFDQISKGVVGWAKGILGDVGSFLVKGVARPDLGSQPFDRLYARMEVVGAFAAFGAFVVAMGQWHQSGPRLWTVARLVLGVGVMPQIPRLVDLAYSVVAQLSSYISGGLGGDLGSITKALSGGFAATTGGLAFGAGLLTLIAGFLILIDLVVVSVGSYIIVVFLPVLVGLAVHPAGGRWLRQALGALAAAVTALFVITGCASLGAAILAGATGSTIGTVLAGAVLLGFTAASPWVLFRLLGPQLGLHRGHAAGAAATAAGAVATIAKVAA